MLEKTRLKGSDSRSGVISARDRQYLVINISLCKINLNVYK
jgi:hypothetical protein